MRALVVTAIAALTVLAGTPGDTPREAEAAPTTGAVTIECGGYDAEGRVVEPEAAALGTITVPAGPHFEIPAVCGGYTADGRFIGDD